jgi:hypothetical protein
MSKDKPHDGGPWYFVPPWRTRAAPTAPSEVPWCTREAVPFREEAGGTGAHAAFGKVRCPRCGRRLQLMTVDVEHGHGDFWPYLPPHKIRVLHVKGKARVKRRVTRDRRTSRGR